MRSSASIPTLTDTQRTLVAEHLRVADIVVKKMLRTRPFLRQHKEDLVQEATLGIIQAATKHDPARGTFFTLAYEYARSFAWGASMNLTRPVSCPDQNVATFETTPAEFLAETSFGSLDQTQDRIDAEKILGDMFGSLPEGGEDRFRSYLRCRFEGVELSGQQGRLVRQGGKRMFDKRAEKYTREIAQW